VEQTTYWLPPSLISLSLCNTPTIPIFDKAIDENNKERQSAADATKHDYGSYPPLVALLLVVVQGIAKITS